MKQSIIKMILCQDMDVLIKLKNILMIARNNESGCRYDQSVVVEARIALPQLIEEVSQKADQSDEVKDLLKRAKTFLSNQTAP